MFLQFFVEFDSDSSTNINLIPDEIETLESSQFVHSFCTEGFKLEDEYGRNYLTLHNFVQFKVGHIEMGSVMEVI